MEDKQCNSCARILPLSRFSPDKRGSGGVKGKCKSCTADQARWARTQKRDTPAQKACASCERVLPASQFFKDGANRSGLTSWCRDCRERAHYGRYRDRRPSSRDRGTLGS